MKSFAIFIFFGLFTLAAEAQTSSNFVCSLTYADFQENPISSVFKSGIIEWGKSTSSSLYFEDAYSKVTASVALMAPPFNSGRLNLIYTNKTSNAKALTGADLYPHGNGVAQADSYLTVPTSSMLLNGKQVESVTIACGIKN